MELQISDINIKISTLGKLLPYDLKQKVYC
jgi:hypothetical protein